MCKQNGLLERNHAFYFQARVPKDLIEYFPKPIIRERLSATTKAEAKAQVRQKWADLEARFAALRQPPKAELPTEVAERILAAAIAMRMGADEESRDLGMDDFEASRSAAALEERDHAERAVAARGDLSGMAEQAHDWLHGYGYELPEDSPEFRAFAVGFARTQQQATNAMKRRSGGEFVETPARATEPTTEVATGAPLLSTVIEYFLKNYDQTKPMYRKHTAVLPLLLQSIGDRPVDTLRQMDIENFAKLVCRLPPRWTDEVRRRKISAKELAALEHPRTVAPKTFEDTYMASVRPFLSTARRIFGDRGFPGHLTTKGIEYRGTVKAGENKQRAFQPDELKRLFRHLTQVAQTAPDRAHELWLPLVALYTGARVNEICQLNPQTDIREEHGSPFFDFTMETEGDSRIRKSIKNVTSHRTVPIHSALLQAGFLDYVKAVRATGAKLLFPQWKPGRGKASDNAEQWFIEALRELGLRDDTPG